MPTTGATSYIKVMTITTGSSVDPAAAQAEATVIKTASASAFAMTGTAAQQQTPAAL